MAEPAASETFGFQTEAKQLLHLMIHSLYSNREIFLRELISNASDAIDKLRFEAVANPDLAPTTGDFRIRITFDEEAGTLSVLDNGIGMSREEVVSHLGTIAKSGTAEFLSRLTGDQKKDASLIGQFGVGFYSAFIVADEVEVLTRSALDGAGASGPGTRWVSRGEEVFSVEEIPDRPSGTEVILHLKSDAREFADAYRLRGIVSRYSDHIGVPVEMVRSSPGAEESSDEAPAGESFEVVNSARALWTRPRTELSDDEYREFYKHVSHDFQDPLTWSHNKVEGKLEYTSLLYVPRSAPFDLWNRDAPRGLKLYVQRVFIMDDAEQFLPLYLRFIKGVVDSSDLPLNVSREILQEDERVTTIRNALTKRALNMLENLARSEPEDYQTFIDEFGEVLKEGAGEDFVNRETVLKLLRFASTAGPDADSAAKRVSLEQYVDRMVEGQDKIYYLVADTFENARSSPHLEVFRKKGIEVLLLADRIDEWMMSMVHEFDGKSFVDVMRGDLALPGGDEAEAESQPEADTGALTDRIQAVLDDRVAEVRPSRRLTDSPACLVLGAHDPGAQMRRILEATGQSLPETKPVFEYNAGHPLLKRLEQEPDEDRFRDLVLILFDQASLADGAALKDASAYVNRLNQLLLALLSD